MNAEGSLKTYVLGFTLSLLLTLAAYFVVSEGILAGTLLKGALGTLAIAQAIVQLILFLHVGTEGKPHWNTLMFSFMALVLFIIVIGSIWIMYNLNYNVMQH